MGIFGGKRPDDTSALYGVLSHGTVDELDGVYKPAWIHFEYSGGGTLLGLALRNKPAHRVALAHRLLDDGADVRRDHPLHRLLSGYDHDFDAEAQLLERLLDAGAEVNEVMPKFGTPLETLASTFKFSDEVLAPFYDVLLARPDLDLLAPGLSGRPVLVNLRKWSERRGDLVARAEQVLTDRGIPLPPNEA